MAKKDVKIMVPLKYLRNFWWTLEMPLINYEINLILQQLKSGFKQDLTGINWYRCGTSHTIFTCLASSVLLIQYSIDHF